MKATYPSLVLETFFLLNCTYLYFYRKMYCCVQDGALTLTVALCKVNACFLCNAKWVKSLLAQMPRIYIAPWHPRESEECLSSQTVSGKGLCMNHVNFRKKLPPVVLILLFLSSYMYLLNVTPLLCELIFTFKVLCGTRPDYWRNHLHPITSACPIRSGRRVCNRSHLQRSSICQETGDGFFNVMAFTLWNIFLPGWDWPHPWHPSRSPLRHSFTIRFGDLKKMVN